MLSIGHSFIHSFIHTWSKLCSPVLECDAGSDNMLTMVQAVKAAAEHAGLPLCIFSPALLRRALRCAGNIVNADEVEQVLSYAISDKQFSHLHNLYLICLAGQPAVVQQIKVVDTAGSHSQAGKTYFIPGAGQKVYKLMAFGRQSLQVAPSESWNKLLK